jgi:5-methyltetrahydrofolate corrinoid/iron sulfur protein methyltransferase
VIIIGEKLNGTLKKTAAAIAERDVAFVQDLAQRQVAAGANYIDVNAGTPPEREPGDLIWLVQTVQAVTDTPLCLDSANPAALAAALDCVVRPPLINSISGEHKRIDGVLPLVPGRACGVIALLLDDGGIPKDVEGRLMVARRLLGRTRDAGIADNQVYVDPLAIAVATRQDGALMALETMRCLAAEAPEVRFSIGLSNISFGLPVRKVVNRVFLTLALAAGLDAAILDPLDDALYSELLGAELLLGRDRFCRKYTGAFRAGRIVA